jgi:carboxyl-terminal processing protease
VLRVRKPEPQKITLTRGPVRLPGVTSKLLADGIGLVQAPSLAEGRVKEVQQQTEALAKQGAKRFILDLRNSGFAKPEDGIALANLFLEKGPIGYAEGQKVKRQDFTADAAKAAFRNQPLVVLTNRGTSNAAEVATAALLDAKRAEVVGEKTYGDAAMRRAVTMEDGSAVLLAVAKYYSPSGKSIMEGVTPTVPVVETEAAPADDDDDEAPPAPPEPKKEDDDAVLKRAIEVLTKGKDAKGQAASAGPEGLPERRNPLTIQK